MVIRSLLYAPGNEPRKLARVGTFGADGVILDLKYEARDVPQRLTSQAAIDKWFEQKTKGLNNFQKAVLRKRWATMRELMSAEVSETVSRFPFR